jgi:hypothetical protein
LRKASSFLRPSSNFLAAASDICQSQPIVIAFRGAGKRKHEIRQA